MLSKSFWCSTFLPVIIFFISCNQSPNKPQRPTFKQVERIKFIELRREFDNGVSFSSDGFQQMPEWELYFLPNDSVKIYSFIEKRYIRYPIYFDHGEVFNFAREWLRLKHVSKDSLVFQLLEVQNREVKKDLSGVYMRFYSESYIKNVLHKSVEELRRPTASDTLYIKNLIKKANKYSAEPDSLLAARKPVLLKSTSNQIRVSKRETPKDDIDYSAANEYLEVAYDIHIDKAFKDFKYSYSVVVDDKGKMTVGRFAMLEEEFKAPRRRTLQAITNFYLHKLLEIIPGSTLGMPHSTEIMLHVKATKE